MLKKLKKIIAKTNARLLYEIIGLDSLDNIKFMNYGIVLDEPIELKNETERLQIQLYHYLTRTLDFRDKAVLEVGCGRGGGSNFMANKQNVKNVTGLDISKNNIRICNRLHSKPNLFFLQGDAEKLHFQKDSFDIVVNVESAHCYPTVEKFISGVYKVLNSFGIFVFCDYGTSSHFQHLTELFLSAGFIIHHQEDITIPILHSLDIDHERKVIAIEKFPFFSKKFKSNFSGTKGSLAYTNFKTGVWYYQFFILKK